jgi:hypothetical protein
MHRCVPRTRRSTLLCATALAGTALLAGTSAQAANCSASDTGTLTTCINNASNGDTIVLSNSITLTADLPAVRRT